MFDLLAAVLGLGARLTGDVLLLAHLIDDGADGLVGLDPGHFAQGIHDNLQRAFAQLYLVPHIALQVYIRFPA